MSSERLISDLLPSKSSNKQMSVKFSDKKDPSPFSDFMPKFANSSEKSKVSTKYENKLKVNTNKERDKTSAKQNFSNVREKFVDKNESSGNQETSLVRSDDLHKEDANNLIENQSDSHVNQINLDHQEESELFVETKVENEFETDFIAAHIASLVSFEEVSEGAKEELEAQNQFASQNTIDESELEQNILKQTLESHVLSKNTQGDIETLGVKIGSEQDISNLSQEEQNLLLKTGKNLADLPNSDVDKLNIKEIEKLIQTNNLAEQVSYKVSQELESNATSQKPILLNQLNAIMAENTKEGGKILGENLVAQEVNQAQILDAQPVELSLKLARTDRTVADQTSSLRITKTTSENVSDELLTNWTINNVTLEDQNGMSQNDMSQNDMSFENEFLGFTNFVKMENSSTKFDVSFEEFVAANKDAAILKPQEQAVVSLKHAISHGKSQISISLYPKSLGHLDIKIDFSTNASGQSEVQKVVITSDRASTLKLFENTKSQLETALSELKRETATTVTETAKKEPSLQFDMRNSQNGQSESGYFNSSEERENWMNKFQNLTQTNESGKINNEENIDETSNSRSHYVTSTDVNIEV